ncbi:MAG: Ku protein, partial [Alphaproteobacteria bacterium HGW-Alphaproteobacteria-15]
YYEKPYFVVPADDLAEEAYIVLREALRQAKKVGLGQLSVRGREHFVSLKPCGRGLVLEMLRYADEVQKAQGYFRDIGKDAPEPELLDLATTLIEKKTSPFAPEAFHDRYVDALKALVEKKAKAKGKKIIEDAEDEPASAGGGNVIDLMAALKKSVGGTAGGAKKAAPRKKATAAKARSKSSGTATRKRA